MRDQTRVLVLASNPIDSQPLRLGEEVRNLKESMRKAGYRDAFEFKEEWAVRPLDLQRALLEVKPQIVHFCGHSTPDGFILESNQKTSILASNKALAKTFKILANRAIECVVLNTCYSESQANEIVRHIPFVVGTSNEIGDEDAISFSEGFYGALGAGESYETAFELGRNLLGLEGSEYEDFFKFKKQIDRNKVPQIWLHGWGVYAPSDADIETEDEQIDWTAYYHRDPWEIPTHNRWEKHLFPELKALKTKIDETYTGRTLDIRSTLSLPAALAFGYTFRETAGYTLQVKQGNDLWRTDTKRSAHSRLKVVQSQGQSGPNLLAGIGITTSLSKALKKFSEKEQQFDCIVCLEPESGTGSEAISSDADVIAYARDAKDLLRKYQQEYDADCIHLVIVSPAGFAFFLGHFMSSLGRVIPYEWNNPDYHSAYHLKAN